jgi:hypothetical protein
LLHVLECGRQSQTIASNLEKKKGKEKEVLTKSEHGA